MENSTDKPKGINLDRLREVAEKHRKINQYIREGKEIPDELTTNFVTFPLRNNPNRK